MPQMHDAQGDEALVVDVFLISSAFIRQIRVRYPKGLLEGVPIFSGHIGGGVADAHVRHLLLARGGREVVRRIPDYESGARAPCRVQQREQQTVINPPAARDGVFTGQRERLPKFLHSREHYLPLGFYRFAFLGGALLQPFRGPFTRLRR